MAKKKNIQPSKNVFPTEQVIFGAFVRGIRVVQNKLTEDFLIKLSSITMLYDGNPDGTLFYTYKDCCYWVPISEKELKTAINSFIFDPDSHWETYGN